MHLYPLMLLLGAMIFCIPLVRSGRPIPEFDDETICFGQVPEEQAGWPLGVPWGLCERLRSS